MPQELLDFLVEYWPLLGSAAILAVGLVICIIFLISGHKAYESYAHSLNERTNSSTIYVINLKTEKVTFFSATNISAATQCTLSEFFAHFPISEQQRVINWVHAVSDETSGAPDFLETDINDASSRKQYFSMLQVSSVDYDKSIIHLESYLLKYMSPSRSSSKNTAHHGLASLADLTKAINQNGKRRGASIIYRFSYKRIQDKDKMVDPLIMNQLKNALFPFTGEHAKCYLMQLSNNQLLLCDLNVPDKPSGVRFAYAGLNTVNCFLSLHGYSSVIDVKVGAVMHSAVNGSGEEIIEQATNTVSDAFNDNSPILWYEKDRKSLNTISESSYRTEVERIISENKIDIFFRPIYSVERKTVMGYFSKARPKNTYFDSMEELHSYATRTSDDKALFSKVARNTIPTFASMCPQKSAYLFFPVYVEDRAHMLHIFSKINGVRDVNTVFLFNEEDIRSHFDPDDPDAIAHTMKDIRAKGYEVALSMSNGELLLPANLYSAFDFFICSFAFAGVAADMDSLVRSQLHSLVEKLLKYQKPIIASDIKGWDSIELLVRSGLRFVSSEDFAPYDTMFTPVPTKSSKRIKDFTNN